jgi:hypothetical protein
MTDQLREAAQLALSCLDVMVDRQTLTGAQRAREALRAALDATPALVDVERLRYSLEAIRDAHDKDPDGGMGYTPTGYGSIDPACLVCGTSDEYAVEWPCSTRQHAEAALYDLARLGDTPDDASEYGRLLAESDRLIGQGVDPADLDAPLPPGQ